MNFGNRFSDCIAILQLANQIRERFDDAPEQFKAISNEMKSLSTILGDIEKALSRQVVTDDQKKDLAVILQGCHNVLIALGKVADENSHLDMSNIRGLRDKSRRVWQRLTLEPGHIQELRLRIISNTGLLNAFIGGLISKHTLEIKEAVQRMHEENERQKRKEDDEAILDWLTPIDYAPEQHDFISRRHVGTGQWLLDSVEFQVWLQADKQTLFCTGIPGAGKTILTSIVIEDLYGRFQTNSSIAIVYLYLNFRRINEQNLDDLLLSLLKQLAQRRPEIPDVVRSLRDPQVQNTKRPSTREISKALHSITSSFSKVYIAIDALDECQVKHRCRPELLCEIFNLQAKCGVNLFITSRHIPDIINELKTDTRLSRLEIHASEQDLRRYLDGQMARLPKCVSRSTDLQEKIKDVIVKTADGMFLLAQLYLESLIDKNTPWRIDCALKELLKGLRGLKALNRAYEEAMRRIKEQEPDFAELAWRVLSWITYAKRPLTSIELRDAISIEPGISELGEDNFQDIEDIVSLCAGLVTIDEKSDVVRLVHYTTQEYFDQMQSSLFPDVQKDIAVVCITYLSLGAFAAGFCPERTEFEARLRLYPLYSYAARYWGDHARAASKELEQLSLDFLKSESKVLAAGQAMISTMRGFSDREPGQLTAIHLAAFFQLNEAIIALSGNGDHIDSKDNYGQTPLSWAAENGHDGTASLLVEMGAEIESKDIYAQTPLLWAIRNGNREVVTLLLDKGAEIESKDKDGGTLLLWAARKGHDSEVGLLFEMGAEIESKDKNNRSPLLWAARNGHERAAELLLEKGADIDSRDNDGRTPISWAAGNGHAAMVRLLLEKGAEFDSKDNDGRTPLSWVAKRGSELLVMLLLEKGADFESKDNKGRTPLCWAVGRSHNAVARLLREKGAKF